ncbi:MAG: peptidylprolyl isomerase [Nitrospinae bacterium]|nr:peptidylprolyl isomerase [Nitrospinota bacterium]MCH7650782.1 peptidylprolyl isomerase [Nitrospinota bacterium]MCZ6540866.1 peptidylprolyl isomerase [Nitrospinota bacterium]
MVGFSYQIQVRHIVVDKKEVAELLKGTIDEVKTAAGRIQMLMRLAEKYSLCSSKEDGGNLGWIELSSDDPRIRKYEPKLKNAELEQIIRQGVKDMVLNRGEVLGPVQTQEGFHLVMVTNEFGSDRSTAFTGSAL